MQPQPPIHSLCISAERFRHCSVIQQIIYTSNHLPDCLVVANGVLEPYLAVSLWLSWAAFVVPRFRPQLCSVPFHSISKISPHALLTMHITSSRWWPQTVSIKLFSIQPHLIHICNLGRYVAWGCILTSKWSEQNYSYNYLYSKLFSCKDMLSLSSPYPMLSVLHEPLKTCSSPTVH